jgi:hypothetical protein
MRDDAEGPATDDPLTFAEFLREVGGVVRPATFVTGKWAFFRALLVDPTEHEGGLLVFGHVLWCCHPARHGACLRVSLDVWRI